MRVNPYFRTLFLILAAFSMASSANASNIDLGFFSYDVTQTDLSGGPTAAQFDISNLTGPNSTSFPDSTFPVTDSVSFLNLVLTVNFSDGSQTVYGSSSGYFSVNPFDSLSYDGSTIAVGGSNPKPVSATLTGDFSLTSLNLNDGSQVDINNSFSASIINGASSGLSDGLYAMIGNYSSTVEDTPSSVPEPKEWLMLIAGFTVLALRSAKMSVSRMSRLLGFVFTAGSVFLSAQANATEYQLGLGSSSLPSTGVAGVSEVKITLTGIPSSVKVNTIKPSNINVNVYKDSCFGTVAATTKAQAIQSFAPRTARVKFEIPESLAQGNYFVEIEDATDHLHSRNCSNVNVTHTNTTIAACLPTSSLAVNIGSANVTAYVPNGAWYYGTTGVTAVPIEGAGAPTLIDTPQTVNSCSSNSATGQTVCVSNVNDVYLIDNSSNLTNTLTSGSDSSVGFSGGSCMNCGVAINALSNKAVIGVGLTGSPSYSGLQVLDLSNNTFSTPVASSSIISEDISIDPTRGLVLSPGEWGNYTLFQTSSNGSLTEYSNQIASSYFDSAAEDCTTGIALAAIEFTGDLYITDLTQAKFTAGSPGTWDAPYQIQSFPEFVGFAAGTSGISIAPGTAHLGLISGEFGGNTFGVVKLPSSSGAGTPSVLDYAAATMPNTPDGSPFSAGYDPHTLTAYTSPNDGRAYAVMADWAGSSPNYLGIIDLAKLLAAPRQSGTNYVDSTYDLLANGVVRYIKIK